ncbi:MAG: 2-oxoacid:acceptor oxidoreductase subunit alpha [Lachnospiraceae bacterium]
MSNIMIGGAAGMGIETTAELLEKTIKRAGYSVLSIRDVMSRVRGGHNFISMRFDTSRVLSHSKNYDVIAAFDQASIDAHKEDMESAGIILCDSKLNSPEGALLIPFAELAKEIGNPKTEGIIIAGVILKLFGIEQELAESVLQEVMKPGLLEVNKVALNKGYHEVETRFDLPKGELEDHIILSGNQAIGLGAVAAGVNFYSQYPMSPSTSIMEYIASVGERAGIVVEQAEDEIAGINMALGASSAGARAMTSTSGGGFCLKVEGIGFAGIAEIPIVAVDVMRPGPATGLPTRTEQSDLKFVISASQGEFQRMVIAVRSHEDAVYAAFRAFQMAEKHQIPVILLSDQYLADSHATIPMINFEGMENIYPDLTFDGEEYLRYQVTESGVSPRLVPGKTKGLVCVDSDEHDEKGWIVESSHERIIMADKRERKMTGIRNDLIEPEFTGEEEPDVLFIGWGSTCGPIAEAVTILNKGSDKKFAALSFGDVFPLPKEKLEKYSKIASVRINVEQNATGQLAGLICEYTGITMDGSILKYDGRQLSGEEIAERFQERSF